MRNSGAGTGDKETAASLPLWAPRGGRPIHHLLRDLKVPRPHLWRQAGAGAVRRPSFVARISVVILYSYFNYFFTIFGANFCDSGGVMYAEVG